MFLSRRKNWLVKVERDKKFHTHRGIVDLDHLIGLSYGSMVSTSLNEDLWILKPTIRDFVIKSCRQTQVVYPKDLGIIAAWTGLSAGQVVVESGTGSGSLTMFAANLVKPNGHVYSYEIRSEFLKVAEKNISRAGLSKFVTLKQANAKEGLDITNADIALIDVGDPWELINPMNEALKGGGNLVAISPTINQIEKFTTELLNHGFINIQNLEVIVREIEARQGRSRPVTRMIGHTAYITFARKALKF